MTEQEVQLILHEAVCEVGDALTKKNGRRATAYEISKALDCPERVVYKLANGCGLPQFHTLLTVVNNSGYELIIRKKGEQ